VIEGVSDQYFLTAFFHVHGLSFSKDHYITCTDETTNDTPTQLQKKLNQIDINVNRILIVRDYDQHTETEKLGYVNKALRFLYNKTLQRTFQWETFATEDTPTLKIALVLMGIDQKGEIEDVHRAIKSQDSSIADCVHEHISSCIKEENLSIKNLDKKNNKMWANNYLRYDCEIKTTGDNFWHKNSSDYFNYRQSIPCLEKLQALFG
jgi:hypothetical protein